MSTAPGAPDEGLLRKIELKADLKPEDVEDQDVQTARQEVLGLAADPAVEERLSKLRVSVQEYRTAKESELATPEAARAKVAIEDIEKAIDEVQAQPRVAVEEPVALGKMQEFGLRMKTAFQKLFKGDFDGFGETLAKGLPLFALRLLGKIPLIGETFKPYIAQAEGIDAARKALSPSELLTTDRDDDLLKQLQGQYDAKPEEFKKSMSFEKFLEARARSARRVSSDRGYTLLSLVNAKLDSELADESTARTKKAEEVGKTSTETKKEAEKQVLKKNSERLDDPRFRDALYTYVLARSLRENNIDLAGLQIDAGDPNVISDLSIDGTTFHYKTVGKAIKDAFTDTYSFSSEKPITAQRLGLVIDDGDLEDDDGGNWVYDPDVAFYFDPENGPVDAVDKLLGIDASSLNSRAKAKVPVLQSSLRKNLAMLLGDFSPYAKKEEDKPAEKPAEPAPADTAAATPAKPSEAPATQTA